MKNRIIWKLSGYFAASLLVFSLVISGVFIVLFRRNAIELHKEELQSQAQRISETMSSLSDVGMGMGKGSGGYGAYIKFLNDIVTADVWLVDQNLDIISYGMGQNAVGTTSQLPENAKNIVDGVFAGKTEFSESFSNILDTPTLTVGTPIYNQNGAVVGAVLLHTPVKGTDLAVSNGILILAASIAAALILSLILSIGFSYSFTQPLKLMNKATVRLAEGDYTAKTGIKQKDEIGALARNIDILALRLDEAAKESTKLEGLRRDFIANISHELRTPITVIRGSLEALCDGVVTEQDNIHEYYSQMLSESKHLERLVGDLLDLSRLQNLDFKLEMTKVSINDLMSDVFRSTKQLAKSKNLSVIFDNRAENCSVAGDYGRLRQMIMIIMDNAVKFSPYDGDIKIDLYKDNKLILAITDQGPGIPGEELPYIFDRFFKTRAETNKTGTGLGLAIAKQIALRHNAVLTAESPPGKGSRFLISFSNCELR